MNLRPRCIMCNTSNAMVGYMHYRFSIDGVTKENYALARKCKFCTYRRLSNLGDYIIHCLVIGLRRATR